MWSKVKSTQYIVFLLLVLLETISINSKIQIIFLSHFLWKLSTGWLDGPRYWEWVTFKSFEWKKAKLKLLRDCIKNMRKRSFKQLSNFLSNIKKKKIFNLTSFLFEKVEKCYQRDNIVCQIAINKTLLKLLHLMSLFIHFLSIIMCICLKWSICIKFVYCVHKTFNSSSLLLILRDSSNNLWGERVYVGI